MTADKTRRLEGDKKKETREIDLRGVVCALSDALDLVGVEDVQHGKRVGIMAAECAAALGWEEEAQDEAFDCGILHDCGVSSTYVHQFLVSEMEWEKAEEHCIRGSLLLTAFPPLAHLAPAVRYHHTRWSDLPRRKLPKHTAELANLVFLVDRVDVQCAPRLGTPGFFERVAEVRESVRESAGTLWSRRLAGAFLDTSERESFWFGLEPRHVASYLDHAAARREPRYVGWSDVQGLATIFARIVDAKSPWTAQHSLGVARLSHYLARNRGLGTEECRRVEVAALLHDLGKLRVPDELLDKPAALDPGEKSLMHGHAFETWQILRRTPGLSEIGLWAALHHENLLGTGYPFHLRLGDFPVQARIIQVADIFQALAQDRPYRKGLSPEAILAHLREEVAAGNIDGALVEPLARRVETCYRLAVEPAA